MNPNLLDLNNDVLSIIGDYVKKDNFKRALIKEEQVLNGKKIIFDLLEFYTPYCMYDYDYYNKKIMKDKNAITKDSIKEYLFFKVMLEIVSVKVNAKKDKIKLSKVDMRKCIWVCFQRYKLILDDYKINSNMEDENNSLDEYLTLKKLNLKSKKYSFNY